MQISALGLGSLRLPTESGNSNRIHRAQVQKVIDTALDSGINYIDTAYTYHNGDSERFLGEALTRYPRESYYLASKFYAAASSNIQTVFEEQIRRCRTEYFDFYLLHGMDETYYAAYTDEKRGYLRYLLEQKQTGHIRYIGFSSHAAPDTLARFLQWYSGFDMALIQLNYLDWTRLRAREQYDVFGGTGAGQRRHLCLSDLGVPCSGCRYCCPTCPAGLDIPLLIKGWNERRISGETLARGRAGPGQGAVGLSAMRRLPEALPSIINI